MPGGPLMIKLLVAATLVLGALALAANLMPAPRRRGREPRSRRTVRFPAAPAASTPADRKAEGYPGSTAASRDRVLKTEAEWMAQLTPEQYRVTRCGETERPYTGKYWDHREEGVYHCVACDRPLFASTAKLEPEEGWPAFSRPFDGRAVDEITDISYGRLRTEVVCSRCESHLGHVFEDGPAPTGLHYRINSASLHFAPALGTEGRPGKIQRTG